MENPNETPLAYDTIIETANRLANWRTIGPFITYFILGEDRPPAPGKAIFNPDFGKKENSWANVLSRMDAAPGVFLFPFRQPAETERESGNSASPASSDKSKNGYTLVDPDSPGFLKSVCMEIKALRADGVRCFHTGGFFSDPAFAAPASPARTYRLANDLNSACAAMREAMGEDAIWISGEDPMRVKPGRIDIFVLSATPPRMWSQLRESIVRRNAGRFWMHSKGHPACQGFFLSRNRMKANPLMIYSA
jgi:hypothetical protein